MTPPLPLTAEQITQGVVMLLRGDRTSEAGEFLGRIEQQARLALDLSAQVAQARREEREAYHKAAIAEVRDVIANTPQQSYEAQFQAATILRRLQLLATPEAE